MSEHKPVLVPDDVHERDLSTPIDLRDETELFKAAAHGVQLALGSVRARIADLRGERERINAEIKMLVRDEARLTRMVRIADEAMRADEESDDESGT